VDPGLFTNLPDRRLSYECMRIAIAIRTLLQCSEYGVEYAMDVAIHGDL
jgi:hypothetical protein